MRRRSRFVSKEEEHIEAHDRWLLTYADMITLLLGLFIILYAISKVDANRLTEVAKDIKRGFGLNVSSVGALLDGGSGILEDDTMEPKSQVFRLWERIGFALKTLREKAKLKLGLAETEELKLTFAGSDLASDDILKADPDLKFAFEQLAELSKGMDIDIVVRVQIPYESQIDKSKFQNSWDYHSHRASLLAEKLVNEYGIPKEQVSVQGYAMFQKVKDSDTPEKKAKEERIEILIRKKETTETGK
ncbi:endoflagellar motor protein [Leptospira mtsangambouensis]|uniref:Endoflagellar motor protein n=1 Tax=Leptospira mtsangambouensis TaxID=2484912 RepID=A0ABY2NVQ0_9LEPT|nr:flagellar motor protein MotB [Leptospira mtsangambouensis]TGM72627.1 endoflagellar motor protein [Leptospira mtsangambouensis]